MIPNELYRPPTLKEKTVPLLHHMAAFPATHWEWELLSLEEVAQWRFSSKFQTVFVCMTFPWGQICSGAAGFLGEESYFWRTRVGSDVTSVSSSSGLRSSVAPEILLSFPVVLREVEEVWSQLTRRGEEGEGGGGLSGLRRIPPLNTMALRWMTDAA